VIVTNFLKPNVYSETVARAYVNAIAGDDVRKQAISILSAR
jgi:hypothetical protein